MRVVGHRENWLLQGHSLWGVLALRLPTKRARPITDERGSLHMDVAGKIWSALYSEAYHMVKDDSHT